MTQTEEEMLKLTDALRIIVLNIDKSQDELQAIRISLENVRIEIKEAVNQERLSNTEERLKEIDNDILDWDKLDRVGNIAIGINDFINKKLKEKQQKKQEVLRLINDIKESLK